MKKEIVIAIVIGIGVGLIITFGMYRASQAVKRAVTGTTTLDTVSTPQDTMSPSPVADAQKDGLVITEPRDNTLTSEATLHVSGKTYPNSAIEVLTTTGEVVGTSDATGTFSLALTLNPGANILIVRSQDAQHPDQEQTRSVIFSTADLSIGSTQTSDAVASPSATPKSKKVGGTPSP